MTSSSNKSTSATLAKFEKQPERVVRVIVTAKPGADAQKRVAAARSAGAASVSTIDGQPMVAIEGSRHICVPRWRRGRSCGSGGTRRHRPTDDGARPRRSGDTCGYGSDPR